MAINWGKKKEHRMTANTILDRFEDGRVMDTYEMFDREILLRQIGIILGTPQKRTPNRIR